MSKLLTMKKPTRLAAAFMALCYFWLSAITSLHHTHGPGEAEDLPAVAAASSVSARIGNADSVHPSTEHQIKTVKLQQPQRCLACEWQADSVAAALPVMQWNFTPPAAPRVITTMPRYLSLPAFAPASRGPPSV